MHHLSQDSEYFLKEMLIKVELLNYIFNDAANSEAAINSFELYNAMVTVKQQLQPQEQSPSSSGLQR